MQTGMTGQALIRAFESCLKPIGTWQYTTYYCPAKVLTIGWGTTRSDVPDLKPGDIWSRQRCDEVFAASLGKYERAVQGYATRRVQAGHAALTQHQFDALVSLVYNSGPGALDGNVGRAVVEGRDKDLPEYLSRWNKATVNGKKTVLAGLVRRRKAEGELWRGDLRAAERTAGTVLAAGGSARSRETPTPTTAELARRTPALTSGMAAGSGSAAGGATTGDGGPSTLLLVGGGVLLLVLCIALAARKWAALREDWA